MVDSMDLAQRPASSSRLVVDAKEELEAALDVRALGNDLARVAELLRVASSVAGECTQVANVRNSVLELFNATKDTLVTARDAARAVLEAQRDVVARFSMGDTLSVTAAIDSLRANDTSAQEVSKAASTLASRVANAADEACAALESLLTARDEKANAARRGTDAAEALQRRRAEAWHSHSALLQSLTECGRLYREQAAAERAAQRRATVAGLFSFVHVADRILGASCGVPILTPVSQYLKGVEDDAKEKSDTTIALLEAKKRQRALSRSALDDLADASRAIRAVSKDAKLDDEAAKSLHLAAGELRKLSASVLKVEAFWAALQDSAGQLSSASYVKLVQSVELGAKVNESMEIDASKNNIWNPIAPVKRRHIQYYSRWAALEEVCDKCVMEVVNAGKLAVKANEEGKAVKKKASAADHFRRSQLGNLTSIQVEDEVQNETGQRTEPMDIENEQVEIIDLTDDSKDGETIGREAAMKAAVKAVR